jgi:hypothetical protein
MAKSKLKLGCPFNPLRIIGVLISADTSYIRASLQQGVMRAYRDITDYTPVTFW